MDPDASNSCRSVRGWHFKRAPSAPEECPAECSYLAGWPGGVLSTPVQWDDLGKLDEALTDAPEEGAGAPIQMMYTTSDGADDPATCATATAWLHALSSKEGIQDVYVREAVVYNDMDVDLTPQELKAVRALLPAPNGPK